MHPEQASMRTRASVAELTGINPETLRYYEREGLLEPPRRSSSGYRLYGEEDLNRLRFVARAKELGFSLQDIREFLELTGDTGTPRNEVRRLAKDHLALIRRKIRDLRTMERTLAALVAECDGKGQVNGCPIAEFLVEGRSPRSKERRSS